VRLVPLKHGRDVLAVTSSVAAFRTRVTARASMKSSESSRFATFASVATVASAANTRSP
jgi:hypothetical protein